MGRNHLVTSLPSPLALLGIIQITAFKPHNKAKWKEKERAANREPEEDAGLGQGDLDAYIRELGPGQDGTTRAGAAGVLWRTSYASLRPCASPNSSCCG